MTTTPSMMEQTWGQEYQQQLQNTESKKTLKIGCVQYLNAAPYISALEIYNPQLYTPAQLSGKLRAGELDLGLIPILECFIQPYQILDGLAIGCRGPVHSVVLIHDKSLKQVHSIAIDSASQTSVNLLRLLCKKYWNISPRFVEEGAPADAQLWIGDRAIQKRSEQSSKQCTDLGEAWHQWTSLPFVFAVWALRPECQNVGQQIQNIRSLCQENLKNIQRLATTPFESEYLTRHICYELGPSQKQGIARFQSELVKASLLPQLQHPLLFI